MSKTLIAKEFRENRWKLVLGLIVMSLLSLSLPLMYDTIIGMYEGFGDLGWIAELIPPQIMGSFSAFLWSQWNAKNLYQIGTIVVILLGMSTIAGEVSNKTISFLLTRPISRRAVFFSKVIAGSLMLWLIIAVSTGAMILYAVLARPEVVEVGRLFVATLITGVGLTTIYLFTVFVSTLLDDSVKAAGVAAVVLLVNSVMGWFNATRVYSIFTHMGGAEYFLGGVFPVWPVLIMLVLSGVFLMAGMNMLERKEF
ncbi:ABC transporter permease [Dethiobacter alkaliphilus]|uniref:ABC transporter permease n=1 Tax=Dethiobacter alkaliphilus TaxID=427926 RepID=UPI0022272C1C|nr:ABC transporter permease [Dethiobacter alkaliphilus]MCW3491665.1 ABC transporter permease [Dethiobacter alkaliphilus]